MQAVAVECLDVPNRKSRGLKSEKRKPEFPRVADALRATRQAHNLTQEEMAPILGLSFAGYRPYERGERDLTQSQIEKIATELGVPISEITARLWPEDSRIVQMRFSADWDELQRQTASLPEPIREQVLRAYRQSLEIANASSDLARRN